MMDDWVNLNKQLENTEDDGDKINVLQRITDLLKFDNAAFMDMSPTLADFVIQLLQSDEIAKVNLSLLAIERLSRLIPHAQHAFIFRNAISILSGIILSINSTSSVKSEAATAIATVLFGTTFGKLVKDDCVLGLVELSRNGVDAHVTKALMALRIINNLNPRPILNQDSILEHFIELLKNPNQSIQLQCTSLIFTLVDIDIINENLVRLGVVKPITKLLINYHTEVSSGNKRVMLDTLFKICGKSRGATIITMDLLKRKEHKLPGVSKLIILLQTITYPIPGRLLHRK